MQCNELSLKCVPRVRSALVLYVHSHKHAFTIVANVWVGFPAANRKQMRRRDVFIVFCLYLSFARLFSAFSIRLMVVVVGCAFGLNDFSEANAVAEIEIARQ